ncbi:uncharacterized protein BKA78DRAFT_171388 [Phyllosticta capitalensis]|uniref:uncharacterized protein n=1 Tax=Phyllosticta capitalensis TaxID=121624 RepID=UPI00313240EC
MDNHNKGLLVGVPRVLIVVFILVVLGVGVISAVPIDSWLCLRVTIDATFPVQLGRRPTCAVFVFDVGSPFPGRTSRWGRGLGNARLVDANRDAVVVAGRDGRLRDLDAVEVEVVEERSILAAFPGRQHPAVLNDVVVLLNARRQGRARQKLCAWLVNRTNKFRSQPDEKEGREGAGHFLYYLSPRRAAGTRRRAGRQRAARNLPPPTRGQSSRGRASRSWRATSSRWTTWRWAASTRARQKCSFRRWSTGSRETCPGSRTTQWR